MSYVFEAGEGSKTPKTYFDILNFLAENRLSRTDIIVALGGGVVGDIAGFAAATYLRGICYIQIPTSLLAMVDSSVGGKTAIDLPVGKNLVGAFKQPSLVICDTSVLTTLPRSQFLDGCAEVIKYGILYSEELFSHLRSAVLGFNRESVIARCVELKRDVVLEDEFDTGSRMKLNLGHTIGHSVEQCSHYAIPHGKAVAIGMAIVSRAAAKRNICAISTATEICELLEQFGLPVGSSFAAQELHAVSLSDKKRTGNIVNLIVPEKIGHCSIRPTHIDELKSFIEAGL